MFKVVWDRENNGVRLTMAPPSGEAINIAPRPVFWEELDFLGADKLGWRYPHCKEPLLWACDRRYFYKGELVLETSGGDMFESHSIDYITDSPMHLQPINLDKLRALNEDSIFLIEHEAMEFIDSEYRKYKESTEALQGNPDIDFQELAENLSKKNKRTYSVIKEDCNSFDIVPLEEASKRGKKIILKKSIDFFVCAFSGGKDSQVVLDLVTRVIPSEDLVVIYSDTGYELPSSKELYKEVKKYYKKEYPNLRFLISANHQPLMFYWEKMGAPSRMLRWCCSIMKSAPLALQLKELNGGEKQPSAILFDGVRNEESVNRASRERIGKNVKHNNIINISPILSWNSTETYLYILLKNLPFNKAYRIGFSRVGCVICPYSSKWSENIASKIYPANLQPFIVNIRTSLKNNKVSGVENYIRLGKWKERAGGRTVSCDASIIIIEEGDNFKAILKSPREKILNWLNILGEIKGEIRNNIFSGTLNYKKRILKFKIDTLTKDELRIEFYQTDNDVILISHLKKIIYKSTYCIHCEVCEVECPTGALSVTDRVKVEPTKCIHCFKCLDFDSKGCLSASSVSISSGEKSNNMKTNKSGINRYNDGMGLRESWLKKYFATYDSFFENDNHGLNPRYQIPPFINWLREARILSTDNKKISTIGRMMADKFVSDPLAVWEIIFINLSENSEITNWFYSTISFGRNYSKQELEIILQDSYPDLKDRTLKNPLNSLLNTFKESPLSSSIPIATSTNMNRKLGITRLPHNELSLVGTAYSLYRYAERHGRYSFTMSELYNPDQKEGIVRQFGIERESLEQILRSLEQDINQVLRSELKMGLDNIILREDLTSEDIIRLLL